MAEVKLQGKEVHYSSGKSYYVSLKSKFLPFTTEKRSLKNFELSNKILQKFVRLIEKKFDSIWYIGSDIMNDQIYERFMFHHGGFMEISLDGELKAFFIEDKIGKFRKALEYAISGLSSTGSSSMAFREIKSGQMLINLEDSLK